MKPLLCVLVAAAGWIAGSSWILFLVILATFGAGLYQWDRVATRKHRRAMTRRPANGYEAARIRDANRHRCCPGCKSLGICRCQLRRSISPTRSRSHP